MTAQAKSLTEVLERLQALDTAEPSYSTHEEADDLLKDALLIAGDGLVITTLVITAYDAVPKWFA